MSQLKIDDTKPICGVILRRFGNRKIISTVNKLTEKQMLQQIELYKKEGYDVTFFCEHHTVYSPTERDLQFYKGYVGSNIRVNQQHF